MEKLQGMNLIGSLIVEYHGDNRFTEGVIDRTRDYRGGLNIDWHPWIDDEKRRATLFLPSYWRCNVGPHGWLFLERIAQEPEDQFDKPCRDVNLYGILRKAGQ